MYQGLVKLSRWKDQMFLLLTINRSLSTCFPGLLILVLHYSAVVISQTKTVDERSGHYQSGNFWLTNSVRLFQYFFWLLRKSLLKLDNRNFLTAVTHWDVTWKIYVFRQSLTLFGALISDEDFGQVSFNSKIIHVKINLEVSASKEIHSFHTSLKRLAKLAMKRSLPWNIQQLITKSAD